MTRSAWLMLLALAACAPRGTEPSPAAAVAANPAVCRVGPDGGPPLADRGIGGTGAPVVQTAERGIGGTGIIGVITGFASICVAGKEVALPERVPARIDGQPTSLSDLRAGQIVAVEAIGPADSLQARQIAVRHVVIGPVEAVSPDMMTVAGQVITLTSAIGPAIGAKRGDWVAVSGLREPDGTILATRVDPASPGPVLVRGELVRIFGTAQIGGLAVVLPDGSDIPGGFPVTVTGRLEGSVLVADSVTQDTVAESPSAYFGPDVTSFIVESYMAVVAGGYFVSHDFVEGSGFGAAGSRLRGIATFNRRPGGGLVATGLHSDAADAPFGRGGHDSFTPAPVPRGGFEGGGLRGSPFNGASPNTGLPGGAFGQPGTGFSPRGFPGQNGPAGGSAPGFGGPGFGGFRGP